MAKLLLPPEEVRRGMNIGNEVSLMDEAVKSMIIHSGESSDYTSTNEEKFWSLSEDE
jgi:hypothetical protein